MRKNLRQKVTCSPIQNHPGFMWGLFDILKHNHWRYIKKRLPHKRPACRKYPAVGTKNEVNNTTPSPDRISTSSKSKVEDKTNIDNVQRPKKPIKSKESSSSSGEKSKTKTKTKKQSNNNNSEEDKSSKKVNSEERSGKTHSEIKKAVKALIKALVIEDKSKRKNRHHRSSTYPVAQQSNPKEKKDSSSSSLSELGEESSSSDKNSSKENDRIRISIGISPAIGSLNPLYLMSEESSYNSDCEEINNIHDSDVNKSEESKNKIEEKEDDDENEEEEEEVWFDPKLKQSKEVSENDDDDDSSPRRSKACLDALNLIHMNRNFLLKVLQDPGSPLARHFQSQQSFSSKTMTKAGSFPTRGSSNSGFDSVGDIDKKPVSPKPVSPKPIEDSSGYTRKRGKNQVVIKRFKDLRQKIKHVINENKNEKHRITMDAVLDKVPRKYGFSKDLRHDAFANLKGKNNNNRAEGGGKMKQIRRASSFCGSLDRYLQLYECSFQREANNNNNRTLTESEESSPSMRVPKFLGRILSSPEMKSPYAWKIEDTPSPFTTSNRLIEQEQDVLEDITEISEDQSQSSEQETLENAEDPTLMIETEHNREISLLDVEVEAETRLLKDSSEERFDSDENPSGFDIQENVSGSKQLDEVLQIEAQDKPKFNYVRDILEISGFNAPESLSMWQLDYQPLDPLVYEEVNTTTKGGCMFQDPECSRNEEEGGNCNHMLLFDLINEVLIEIYERSYHYCPIPLSTMCKIHPMPLGYSVLKEVWVRISCYLRYKPYDEVEQSFDKIMSRDMLRDDSWMDLQFESECVGIEVEDLIFEELLEELIVSV